MVRLIVVALLVLLVALPVQAQQLLPVPAAVLADGPVGYWRLNEPGSVSDLSGRFNHGTYVGGVQTGVSGVTADGDQAVQLDGVDDYIAVPDSPSLSPTATVSVEAWVYLDALPASAGRLYRVAGKTGAYGLYLEAQFAGTMVPEFTVQHPGQATRSEAIGPRTIIRARQWHHLAGTYDGSISRLYVDGVEVANLTHSGPIADTSSPLWISGPQGNWSLPGKVDEVAVYPRALTAQQVAAHRAAASQVPPTPTPTSTATLTPTATSTPTDIPTPTPTDTPIPASGVLCAGFAVGDNAVTLTCARDNTATPWPSAWPGPAGWP